MSIERNKKRIIILTIALLLVGFAGILLSKKLSVPKAISLNEVPSIGTNERAIPTPPPEMELPTALPTTKLDSNTKHINILVLGYGGAGHQGGFLSDVIMLISIDLEKRTLAFIHIPRDLYMSIPVGQTKIAAKINSALAMGTKSGNYPTKDLPDDSVLRGAYLSKLAIKQITGRDIHYVIGIDFSGFTKAIDTLGGIEIVSKITWEDQWYPIKGRELELCGKTPEEVTALSSSMTGFNLEKQFPCRYETLHFNQGKNQVDGTQALKFVRSRHSSTYGGDFARGEKQTAVLVGVMNKLFSLQALDKIPAFYASLSKTVKTDISLDNIKMHLSLLKELPQLKIKEIGLSTANVLQSSTSNTGASILLPKTGEDNWTETRAYIDSQLNN